MMTEANKGWRHVVQSHLQAAWEDAFGNLQSALSSTEARFLAEYATEAVRQGYHRAAKAHCDMLGPVPPKDSYEVVEESAHRVLAQVRRPRRVPSDKKLPFPLITTRVLLVQSENAWQIAGIYQACISCNHRAPEKGVGSPGKCFFCDGKGTEYGTMQVYGSSLFERCGRETGMCEHCGGTGSCAECEEEEEPGWRRVFSLRGLKEGPFKGLGPRV